MHWKSNTLKLGLGCALAALLASGAQAKFKVLHSFVGGFDGSDPESDLFIDPTGVLYGTTRFGGIGGNNGTLFKIVPGHKEKVLHSFSGGASDGAQPSGGVISDKQGSLYGVTENGGVNGLGVVYKLTSGGTETLVHTFQGICCGTDGSFPYGNLAADADGNIYGVTYKGGGPTDLGSVFEVKTDGSETVVHGFTGGADGSTPRSGLAIDSSGALYGNTLAGGPSDVGTVYKITSAGVETVLLAFSQDSNGYYPHGTLVLDKSGNVFGSTLYGGSADDGAIYVVTPAGIETVVHSFINNGTDGAFPVSSLIKDKNGNLYGTTAQGGINDMGTVFELKRTGEEKVLHSFAGSDGSAPRGGVVLDANGNLYGTTSQGGANNLGVVFEITARTKTPE